jgi:penicillin amidase
MRFLKRFVYVSGGLVVVAAIGLWLAVRASLPQLDGARTIAGLSAPVVVSRDAIGVVTIRAGDRRDAALATGFVHAQERLFQMDLMRRFAAGELSALVGVAAAGHDAAQRLHRMRSVARRVMDRAEGAERAIVEAYAAGVNAGIDALPVRPFEYLILGAHPTPWRAEDTVLAVLAMYFRLHDERASRESRLARLHEALSPEMYAFLTQAGTPWDAPLVGAAVVGLPVPGAGICDVRRVERNPLALAPGPSARETGEGAAVGSNAWALSPRRTRDGVAIVANDMHLGLAMPNIWFRLRLRVDGPGEGVDVTGVTLPGTPAIVAGSNGRVAWGLTNSYGDWVDLVELEIDPADPGRYLTPDGYRRFEAHREIIEIQGAEPRHQVVRGTVWGPVIDAGGGPRALRWLAHDAEATNLALLEMEQAGGVQEALAVARRSGIPPQNLILADSDGNIAWTVAGRMPRRRGFDPLLPGRWSGAGRGWFGFVAPEDYPEVVNPSTGALWTANARVADGEALALIGDGGYALGARARQIRDTLLALDDATEADMLAIQLDDRALFLAPWRRLLLGLLDAAAVAGDPRRAELRRAVAAGGRRAAADDAGYRLVRAFRREVAHRVFVSILVGCADMDPGDFPAKLRQWEGALWRILQERPMHLLAAGYADWDSFLLAAADTAARSCGDGDLDECTWGGANRVRIRHPLSRALPVLSSWLDMPTEALPGDLHMPRVQAPSMGASLRFAVAPGRESSGYFHMPGGQSGHPMSPYYDAGHRAWAEGEATPFLPGPDRHTLSLEPPGADSPD